MLRQCACIGVSDDPVLYTVLQIGRLKSRVEPGDEATYTAMFSPNLSNRGKAVFVVGIVVVVSLFWLLSWSRTSDSPSNSEEQVARVVKGVERHNSVGSKMAEKTVELHKDLNLFSPPLPTEVEEKKKDVTVVEKTVEVDVSFRKFYEKETEVTSIDAVNSIVYGAETL